MKGMFVAIILSSLFSCLNKTNTVNTDSMLETITPNSTYELEEKISYAQNDIVLIRYFDKIFNKEVETILRVVAIPKEKFEIRKGEVYVNSKKFELPRTSLLSYELFFNENIDSSNVTGMFSIKKSYQKDAFLLSEVTLNTMLKQRYIDSFKRRSFDPNEIQNVTIGSKQDGWNMDNIGPIQIMAEGEDVGIANSTLYYGLKSYSSIVNSNFYVLIADNFYESIDTRIIGLIPQKNIVGMLKNLHLSPLKKRIEVQ